MSDLFKSTGLYAKAGTIVEVTLAKELIGKIKVISKPHSLVIPLKKRKIFFLKVRNFYNTIPTAEMHRSTFWKKLPEGYPVLGFMEFQGLSVMNPLPSKSDILCISLSCWDTPRCTVNPN